MIYNYDYSFKVNEERIRRQTVASNIHQVIKETRKDYPEAHTFIVIKKSPSVGAKSGVLS